MKALAWLGVAFMIFGLVQVSGVVKLIPCAVSLLGICTDPFNGIENLMLGLFFVVIGALLLIKGVGKR